MLIGKGMVHVWHHTMTEPGVSKRAAAASVVKGGWPSPGYRIVDRAIAVGLVDAERLEHGGYRLYAVPVAEMPDELVRGLAAHYTRAKVDMPPALLDRLTRLPGKTA